MGGCDLGDCAGGVTDGGTQVGAEPAGCPSPSGYLLDGVGEHSALAVAFSASPAGFVPAQNDSMITVRNVFRCGRCLLLSGGGEDPTSWAGAGEVFVGDRVDYSCAIALLGHVDHLQSG